MVPPGCAQAVAVPPELTVDIAGHGWACCSPMPVTERWRSPSHRPSPRPLAAYLIDRPTSKVLWETSLASDAVVAAFDGGIVFLWDDKIGYAISASSGDPLGALVRSDNYRGIFLIGGSRYLQLDAEVTAVGLGGSIFSYHAFQVAGIIDGCAFGLRGS